MDGEAIISETNHADGLDLDKLRDGCTATAEKFVREYAPRMLNVARRILRDDSAAEDVVQEAFNRAFQKLSSFEERSTLSTWLHRIVVNQALMSLRTLRRRAEEPLDHLLPDFDANACRIEESWPRLLSAHEICEQNQLRAIVREKIDQLPETYRIVLLLRDIEDMSTADVAEQLELSQANVKVRLHRARSALKTLLEPVLRGQIS